MLTRTWDGRRYQLYLEYSTKAEAKKRADTFHKSGYGARVVKSGGEWLVYVTRYPIK